MIDADIIKTCALLHDIGKPVCWAKGKPWGDHIYYTYDIVSEVLGESYANLAMKHHSGESYPEKYRPSTLPERIVWLADKLSSGADRRELPESTVQKPSPPFSLTHPLSSGDSIIQQFKAEMLEKSSTRIIGALKSAAEGFDKDPSKCYLRIYKALEGSDLRFIPADTRPPINDVSLWHHSKLSAAFAGCLTPDDVDGLDVGDFDFILLSGDADKISSYIQESSRIPDLNARSERVKESTRLVASKLEELIGPECVLFAGGGSVLALCPGKVVGEIESRIQESFEESMLGDVSFTVSLVKDSGDRFQSQFGMIWKRAGRELRLSKMEKPIGPRAPIESRVKVCDVCHKRPAEFSDEERMLSVNASPRPEELCSHCWELRRQGKGVWIEDLALGSNHLALLKADGDSIGEVLDGTRLKEMNKQVTPSRLSALSSLLNEVCEDELRRVVERHNGKVIFAGGDDILAIFPAERVMNASLDVYNSFRKAMNNRLTMSAGISIFPKDMPIYAGLESAHELIRVAKSRPGKNGVAYRVLGGLGRGDGTRALGWDELEKVLDILDFFKRIGLPHTQVRRIASVSSKPYEAEVLIKYLVGKRRIPWSKGEELLRMLDSGLMADGFMLYNLFKVGEKNE
ncbi:type III-B CRISPR-associated protein Cas10/Cmr2 [Candidatus Bathyarchaeota archaeon]|nr:type III-B CRISPR-associated protein Cas10/Cmr2 [Candidatus Bathyarchaeota archaeon]